MEIFTANLKAINTEGLKDGEKIEFNDKEKDLGTSDIYPIVIEFQNNFRTLSIVQMDTHLRSALILNTPSTNLNRLRIGELELEHNLFGRVQVIMLWLNIRQSESSIQTIIQVERLKLIFQLKNFLVVH